MRITSPTFEHNSSIPAKYTCDGENISPPLNIEQIPDNAKSLVLIVDDPDAPAGTWVHWLIWNINPNTSSIQENSIPPNSIEGTTSFGNTGYGGPCPPNGTHRYFFRIYALDTSIELNSTATKSELEKSIVDHIVDHAELIGLYHRK